MVNFAIIHSSILFCRLKWNSEEIQIQILYSTLSLIYIYSLIISCFLFHEMSFKLAISLFFIFHVSKNSFPSIEFLFLFLFSFLLLLLLWTWKPKIANRSYYMTLLLLLSSLFEKNVHFFLTQYVWFRSSVTVIHDHHHNHHHFGDKWIKMCVWIIFWLVL